MGLLTILCLVFWKESYAPILLARKAARLRKETGNQSLRSKYDMGLSPRAHLKRGIGRAVKMLVFSPIVLSLSVYMGLIYSYFYLLFTTFTPIFEENYHFSPSTVGLSYLGVGVGFMIGQASFAKLGDPILKKCAKRFGNGELEPEYRLPLYCIGALFIPVALFWYGWSVVGHVHWLVPIIGTGFLGCGNSLIFVGPLSLTNIREADVWSRLQSKRMSLTHSRFTLLRHSQQIPLLVLLWQLFCRLRARKCIKFWVWGGEIHCWLFWRWL
jgi:hypothetical protein